MASTTSLKSPRHLVCVPSCVAFWSSKGSLVGGGGCFFRRWWRWRRPRWESRGRIDGGGAGVGSRCIRVGGRGGVRISCACGRLGAGRQ